MRDKWPALCVVNIYKRERAEAAFYLVQEAQNNILDYNLIRSLVVHLRARILYKTFKINKEELCWSRISLYTSIIYTNICRRRCGIGRGALLIRFKTFFLFFISPEADRVNQLVGWVPIYN